MPNPIINPKVWRHFHLGQWFLICAIEPLIDHQNFNFFEFDLVNFSPYNHVFFFQFDHWFWISSIKSPIAH
jgi:hypothetical protein